MSSGRKNVFKGFLQIKFFLKSGLRMYSALFAAIKVFCGTSVTTLHILTLKMLLFVLEVKLRLDEGHL